MAKSELEIVSKMLRYKAEVEDKSYPRVVVRQLCDAVLGHNRDAVELIRQALDNQITMQDMIVRSCGIHFLFIPAAADKKHGGEKICANDVLNKAELRNFHSALQKYLLDHGVQANILTGITKTQGGNRTVRELKQENTKNRWHSREYDKTEERGRRWD